MTLPGTAERVRFVKGHMGGNQIVLAPSADIPPGREVAIALEFLEPLSIGGHQLGLLSAGEAPDEISVKIIGRATRGFISMCGGLTQVLGELIRDPRTCAHLDLQPLSPPATIRLSTDAGLIGITLIDGAAGTAYTEMTPFIAESYDSGVVDLTLDGVGAVRVGKFLVVDADEIRRAFPDIDLEELPPEAEAILVRLQQAFQARVPPPNVDFALYDFQPQFGGHARVVYPHDIARGHIEPACGTGSVAVAIAMNHLRSGPFSSLQDGEDVELRLEAGHGRGLGGRESTRVVATVQDGRLVGGGFSHDRVELLAQGELRLPT